MDILEKGLTNQQTHSTENVQLKIDSYYIDILPSNFSGIPAGSLLVDRRCNRRSSADKVEIQVLDSIKALNHITVKIVCTDDRH
jgi:hypothetical protein